jgi:hypothetical protein
MFEPWIKATGMPNRGYRFVLPIFCKWRDLVIGGRVEVLKVSGNCQVLKTGWTKTALPI